MSEALQRKINELFEATKDLRSLEEIKVHCESFNEWVNTSTSYINATLGTKLSKYEFYKKFRSIPLEQDKNAVLISKHNENGTVKGSELKHYAIVLCGLNKEQWNERNQTTRVIDRLENSTEIDPDRYLETTGKLLASEDPHELAVGIIAATGRRPHEIIARAKFTAIKDKPYHVLFAGQGKKRGDTPVFEIATLYPADHVIKALARLRKEPSTQALLKETSAHFPKDEIRQNDEIDNRRGQSLRRVVRTYFGDKGDNNPVLAFRYGEEQDNNKALRSAYAVLASERDCEGSFGAKLLYASRLLGHFVKEDKDDRDLTRLGVSAGYSDYYVPSTKKVRFAEVGTEIDRNAKVHGSDLDKIKELQKKWNLPSQKDAVRRLLKEAEHNQSLERQLIEAQGKIAHLQEQLNQIQTENQQLKEEREKMNQQPQVTETTEVAKTSSDSRIDKLEERMDQMMEMIQKMASGTTNIKPEPKTETEELTAPVAARNSTSKKDINWEDISNEQLKNMRSEGAVEEKIYRAFHAITQYNDSAPSNDDRWYIGSTTLSQVSGCNRQAVGAWIKAHITSVKDANENSRYTLEQYHNKRHKGIEITEKVKLWADNSSEDKAIQD